MKHTDTVSFIQGQRILWLDHIQRMYDHCMPNKILKIHVYKSKKRCRSRIRRLDDVLQDQEKINIKDAKDRRSWKRLVLANNGWYYALGCKSIRILYHCLQRNVERLYVILKTLFFSFSSGTGLFTSLWCIHQRGARECARVSVANG